MICECTSYFKHHEHIMNTSWNIVYLLLYFLMETDLSKKFWSTKDQGQQPFTFAVGMGQVIKGWDEGVIGMSLGEVAKIHCSPDYAYGTSLVFTLFF